MIEHSVSVLYTVTVALKAPVVVGILLALVWSLFELGWFLREWLDRARISGRWNALFSAFTGQETPGDRELLALLGSDAAPDLVRPFVRDAQAWTVPVRVAQYEGLLHDLEFAAARRLSRMRVGLRIGPVLGLMGTLIPMGPALMSISQGNLKVMSNDLIIAFSTTVAGLFVGALCYVMLIARQYWYGRHISETERMVNMVMRRTQA